MALLAGESEHSWSSGTTFILAAIGAAVGLGNIWKFPYVVGVSGGGAFVLVYIICVALIAIPILIGEFEAGVINRRLLEEPPFRPLTHDLLKMVIDVLGGEPQEVVITEMKDHTYFAVLKIAHNDQVLEVDCRPSDAVALSMHYDPPLPIFVSEDVLAEVS